MILTNATGLPPIALAGLKWSDVRIRASKGCVEIDPPPFKRLGARSNTPLVVSQGPPGACLIEALRDLKQDRGPGLYVMDGNGGEAGTARVARYLDPIPGRGPGLWPRPTLEPDQLARTLNEARRPRPTASRDLALIVISHHLALASHEAVRLYQGDFTHDGQTLTVEIPGRREPVHLHAAASLTCPLKAWTAWSWHLNDQAQDCSDSPFFRVVFDGRIWDKAMMEKGLNRSFQARVYEAHLTGEYTYAGLRSGAIRGWLREGLSELHVAHRSGLASLSAVGTHERRESMIAKSVAGLVGL